MPRRPLPSHLRRQPGRPSVYPWDRWLNGQDHLIRPEVDFDCSLESMRQQIYIRARKEGVQVTVRRQHDGLVVTADRQKKPPGSNRYDWDFLFDGNRHELQIGKDFAAKPESFRAYARAVATARGLRLITRTIGNIMIIWTVPKSVTTPATQLVKRDPLLSELPFAMED